MTGERLETALSRESKQDIWYVRLNPVREGICVAQGFAHSGSFTVLDWRERCAHAVSWVASSKAVAAGRRGTS